MNRSKRSVCYSATDYSLANLKTSPSPSPQPGTDPSLDGSAGVRKASFARHVATLASGTVVAQIIPIALTPVLTRIFSPADFGYFAVFTSISSIAVVGATLRFSYALLLPEREQDALRLASLCVGIAFAFSLLIAVVLFAFRGFWIQDLSYRLVSPFIPVATLFGGLQITLYSLGNRERAFKALSASKVVHAGFSVALAIALAPYFSDKAYALIAGYLAGQLMSVVVLAKCLDVFHKFRLNTSLSAIGALAKRYRSFAFFSLPADLINTFANQLPVFFLTYYFVESIVGQYNLTFRVILGPLGIVGVAILDVFKERAARDYSRTGTCRPLFIKVAVALALVGVPSLLALYPSAPFLFSKLFGPEWRDAGEYARIFIPLFIGRFIVSPLSYVIYIAEKQFYDLVWQLCLLCCVVISFYIGGNAGSVKLSLNLFSWSYAGMYVIYFFMNYYLAERKAA